ncbi:pyruvate kinase [Musca domestica]|uniref:Pyruvate kinase n=1 Tax=Musca domestica TaxID=7370 RepID=A0A9J7DCQ4_MUSDO|nr:pyruvate kinase [Musca domestica]
MESQITSLAEISRQMAQKLNRLGLRKLRHAHKTLTQLQQKVVLSKFGRLEDDKFPQNKTKKEFPTQNVADSEQLDDSDVFEESEAEEEDFEILETVKCSQLSEDSWLGYFAGYEILNKEEKIYLNGNKQCIELSGYNSDPKTLEDYLRAGMRCFFMDLFVGTEVDKQRCVFNLRNCELKISQEYGYPVNVSLFAILSPRCQYTGYFDDPTAVYEMEKGETLTLTTNRQYSTKGCRRKIYVRIISIVGEDLNCEVMECGVLRSKSAVRFPGRCNRSRVSVEEIEDITFAREMGIGVLISYIAGTELYLKELQEVLGLLNCQNMQLGCRVVLNEMQEKENTNFEWIVKGYDVFLIEFKIASEGFQEGYKGKAKEITTTNPEILNLSRTASNFLKSVYRQKKAIIMDCTPFVGRQLFVDPCNWPEVFYYPDKYFIKSDHGSYDSFQFHLLQRSIFNHMFPSLWSSSPFYCDESQSGCDTIARSCIAASLECNAAAILLCSILPDMAIKLSHFRPITPIYFLSATKSTADYISMYHNVIYLYQKHSDCYRKFVTEGFLCGLTYLHDRKLVTNGRCVILMYGHNSAIDLPDKYVILKFNAETFEENLNKLFIN